MEPKELALYAMIALGAAAGAAAIAITLRRGKQANGEPKWKPVFLGALAFGLLGVGGFGPSFLGDYAAFLKDVAGLQGAEQKQAYEKIADDLATGKVPDKYKPLVESYVLEHPIENLDAILEDASKRATPDHKPDVERLRADLARKRMTADFAVKGAVSAAPATNDATTSLEKLDSAALRALRTRTPSELSSMKLDRATLESVLAKRRAGGS